MLQTTETPLRGVVRLIGAMPYAQTDIGIGRITPVITPESHLAAR